MPTKVDPLGGEILQNKKRIVGEGYGFRLRPKRRLRTLSM